MKLLGIEVKNGIFTKDGKDISYNNLIFYVQTNELKIEKDDSGTIKKWGVGHKCETFKIKNEAENLRNVFGVDVDDKLLSSMVGQDINIYFDAYGKVQTVMFVKPQKA